MNHNICEYMLYAEKQGLRARDITYKAVNAFSPYMECLPDVINRIVLDEQNEVEVNPYYRYGDVFSQLMAGQNEDILMQLRQFIFDYWIHEAFKLERLMGMTHKTFERAQLVKELRAGELGEYFRNGVALLQEEELDALMNQVQNLYASGEGILLFRTALKIMFGNVYVYELDNAIMIYVGERESAVAKQKVELLKDIFLPIGTKVEVFWNKHFGIFGIEDTMVLDEMVLI